MVNRRASALLWLVVECVAGSSLGRPPARLLKLRGGDDEDTFLEQLKRQGNVGPLCREEVVEKLNAVPTFCILQDDGSVISLPDTDGEEGDECCTWFIDAAEAQATLKRVAAANPDLTVRLASHGLGAFIQMSDGWPRESGAAVASSSDAPRLKLRGSTHVDRAIGSQLLAALKGQGLEAGLWRIGVFVAEDLAQATPEGAQILLPVFLSPDDVRAAYAKAGIPANALEGVKVLELRQLLKAMLEGTPDAVNPWRATRFITSHAALQLAQEMASKAA